MADVFVSYKRDDLARVAPLVEGLRSEGLTVWWDRDIAPGAPWETTIEHELERASAVIVAWSPAATASENVKSEARFARNQGRLIQLLVAPCVPPIFFGEQQGVELNDWTGDRTDSRFQAILAAARALLAGQQPADGVGYASHSRRSWRPVVLIAIALTIAAALLIVMYPRQPGGGSARLLRNPAAPAASSRQILLNGLAGSWDRQDGDCTAPIVIDTAVDATKGDVITVQNRDGFRSIGAIIAVENGAVISRDMSVNAGGHREQWEYRPVGNDMTVIDGAGVATKLVRCRDPRQASPRG